MARLKAKLFLGDFQEAKCPFCGCFTSTDNPVSYCPSCYIEWEKDENGDVFFDTEKKSPKFAWAKAIAKSGGTRMGNTSK